MMNQKRAIKLGGLLLAVWLLGAALVAFGIGASVNSYYNKCYDKPNPNGRGVQSPQLQPANLEGRLQRVRWNNLSPLRLDATKFIDRTKSQSQEQYLIGSRIDYEFADLPTGQTNFDGEQVATQGARGIEVLENWLRPGVDLALLKSDTAFWDEGTSPRVIHVWPGLGGHLGTLGSAVPVIALVQNGTRPFHGWFSVDGPLSTWRTRVNLSPGQTGRVELEISASGNTDNDFRWSLVPEGCEDLSSGDFHLESPPTRAFWLGDLSRLAPHSAGFETAAIIYSPVRLDKLSRRQLQASRFIWRKVDLVSPEQSPEAVAGWDVASTLGVDPTVEARLSAKQIDAICQWVTRGGTVALWPGGKLLRRLAGARSLIVGDFAGPAERHIPCGLGRVWIEGFYYSDVQHYDGKGHVVGGVNRSFVSDYLAELSREDWHSKLPEFSDSVGDPPVSAPTLRSPGWPVLLSLGGAYAMVFGPVTLWLMRRMRRVMQVWLVAPVMAAGLTLAILLMGPRFTNQLQVLNHSTVTYVNAGDSVADQRTSWLFFTPTPGNVTIPLGSLQGLSFSSSCAASAPVSEGLSAKVSEHDSVTRYDSPDERHQVELWHLPAYAERIFTTRGDVALGGVFELEIHKDRTATVANRTNRPVGRGALTVGDFNAAIPALKPGGVFTVRTGDWKPRVNAFKNGDWDPVVPIPGVQSEEDGEMPLIAKWEIPHSPWDLNVNEFPKGAESGSRLVVSAPLELERSTIEFFKRHEGVHRHSPVASMGRLGPISIPPPMSGGVSSGMSGGVSSGMSSGMSGGVSGYTEGYPGYGGDVKVEGERR